MVKINAALITPRKALELVQHGGYAHRHPRRAPRPAFTGR
jgi:hypothetical protein